MFESVIAALARGGCSQAQVGRLLEAVVDALAGVELNEVDDAAVGERIALLQRQTQRLEAERLRCVAAFDRRTAWRADGARSAKEWLATRCNLSRGEAAGQLALAKGLARLPATSSRLAAGDMSLAQARPAAALANQVDAAARAELDAVVAEQADAGADSATVRAAVDDWAHRHDERLLAERRAAAHARRRLSVRRSGDGCVHLDGRLDQLGGEALLTALQPLSAPAGADDARTPEQRRADALVELARRALDAAALPHKGGERPHVTVTVNWQTLAGQPGSPPAWLDYTGAADAETARMFACDAAVARVVFAGGSQPLDVGRASRTVTPGQRRALTARDRGCRGCGAPAGWCHAHHIVHWAHGGATDLANLALLCWTCHDNVHHHGWSLARGPDGHWQLHPPDRRPPPRVRRPGGPQRPGPPAPAGHPRAAGGDRRAVRTPSP